MLLFLSLFLVFIGAGLFALGIAVWLAGLVLQLICLTILLVCNVAIWLLEKKPEPVVSIPTQAKSWEATMNLTRNKDGVYVLQGSK